MSTLNVFKKLRDAAKRLLAKKKSMDKDLKNYPELVNDLDKYYFTPYGFTEDTRSYYIERLSNFLNLPINWDINRGKPLEIETIKHFIEFCKINLVNLKDYGLFIETDGWLLIENNDASFSFRNNGVIEYSFLNSKGKYEITGIVGNLDDLKKEYA